MTRELQKANQKRLVYTTRITEIYTIAVKAKNDPNQHSIFKTRYESLEEFYDEFKKFHNEVIGLIEAEQFKEEDKIRSDTDNFYFQTKNIYYQLFPDPQPQNFVAVPTTASNNEYRDFLKLDVPIFDGNLLEWVTFYDMFCSLVHNNDNIHPVRKFRHLISHLKGEPLNLIKSLPISDNNYTVAFKTLTDRYQNVRLLATSYWNTIYNTNPLKNNCSSKDLRVLLDTFNENIAALDCLGYPTDQWQFPLFNMLLMRLNTSIRTSFELEHSKVELPTYNNLNDFLNAHCRALESVQSMPNISFLPMQSQNSQKSYNSYSNNSYTKNNYNSNKPPKFNHTQSYVANTELNIQNNKTPQSHANQNTQLSSMQNTHYNSSSGNNQNRFNSNNQQRLGLKQSNYKCRLCNQAFHNLSQCEIFLAKNVNDRIHYIKQNNACSNCLRFSHLLNMCQSSYSCRSCGQRHHTLLHPQQPTDSLTANNYLTNVIPPVATLYQNTNSNLQNCSNLTPNQQTSQNTQFLHCGCTSLVTSKPQNTVLLSTINVDVLDAYGNYQTVRAVLDSASQANFISESCLNRLGLAKRRFAVPILGINQSSSTTKGITTCTIKPVHQNHPQFTFDILILPKVCSDMPSLKININNWQHISNLKLGDEKFNIPAPVDILLGAHAYSQIIKPGVVRGEPDQPIIMETVFGWVVLGNAQTDPPNAPFLSCHFTAFNNSSLDQSIAKFWEVESLPTKAYLSPDDQKCESFYQKTLTRDNSGRFQVSLPFRHSRPDLGDTYVQAYKCFLSLESKLLKNPTLYSEYSDFMKNYLKNDHMTLIPITEPKPKYLNYLPHHCVVRPEKCSTKVRVVFNASAKGSKGISLNSTLLSGPKLQTDINKILLNFRFYSIVLLSDITQMFLQIRVAPEDRDYQRLLWRFSPDEPIQAYRLNTVTFGVSSSPFLAIRTIRELANEQKQKYPEASRVLLENIFVDDVCAGANSIESALALQKDLIDLLRSGCFELKKWASNDCRLLSSLSPEKCQIPFSLDKENPISIKVLGLQWDPYSDNMFFSCQPSTKLCTKRNILSNIASIFDPLGMLAPISFFAKCLMQKLWISKIGWDDLVEKSIFEVWSQFQNELPELSKISFPRHIFSLEIVQCQLHGFSDASELGYAACVYLRLELPSDVIKTSLVMARSRVSPLKTVSIPRLELLGTALLSELLKFVIDTYSPLITIDQIFAYTDSQVVLHWISGSPHRWKTFVANRVSQIQENLPHSVNWFHVRSEENPADVASRGIMPANFINHPLWFEGPQWLKLPVSHWNLKNPCLETSNMIEIASQEEKCITLTATVECNFLNTLLTKFSSLIHIQKIICHCRRIFYNFKNKDCPLKGPITVFELQESLLLLVKRAQDIHFSKLILQIQGNELLPKPFRKIAPFLDIEGFVRVGGRLRHTETIPFESKYPLLLPRSDRFTQLLIEHIHKENCHPGLTTIQHLLRQQFWILSPRRAISSVISKCVRCFRLRPKAYTPYQGDLPFFRISQLKCFSHVTIDYAGPLKISPGRWYRGPREFKAYICIFVCTSTRAIHIEVASDLTSDCFIAVFRRFVARRGRCNYIYSDNGTNFVGANKQLLELSKFAAEHLHIKWHFFPSASPHFNGLSEAGVKSTKTHLYRVIGEQKLTYEELNTLLVQIEALLNSRPISAQSSDPNDFVPLTPGHFLTMEPLNSCPDPDTSHLKLNTLSRWQLVQRLNADFWRRWKEEYLSTLQQRSKWTDAPSTIILNTLVLIKNENKPPLHWSLGRIVELHPGADGLVRVVTIKTPQGLFKRPIVKLCPLPMQEN